MSMSAVGEVEQHRAFAKTFGPDGAEDDSDGEPDPAYHFGKIGKPQPNEETKKEAGDGEHGIPEKTRAIRFRRLDVMAPKGCQIDAHESQECPEIQKIAGDFEGNGQRSCEGEDADEKNVPCGTLSAGIQGAEDRAW